MNFSDTGVPIKLTKEWLIKLEFEPIRYSHLAEVYSNGKLELADDFSISFNVKHRIILKTVHQLQNIYFEIYQEELKYKK